VDPLPDLGLKPYLSGSLAIREISQNFEIKPELQVLLAQDVYLTQLRWIL
jgi:hypothetical protein